MFVRDNDERGNSLLSPFMVVNVISLEMEKVLGWNMICCTSSEVRAIPMRYILQDYFTERAMLNIIIWCWIFGFLSSFGVVRRMSLWVIFFWNGSVVDDGLVKLTYFCNIWVVVGCDSGTLWYGVGGKASGTETLWVCTRRETGRIVGVGVKTGRMITVFFIGSYKDLYYFDKCIFGSVTMF